MPFSRVRRSGFTLIELLVVIAIIAILAAILFPVFAQARGKARQAACLSNTKQIGLALMQYSQDYDETYPGYRFAYANPYASDPSVGSNAKTAIFINQILDPYIKSEGVWRCPSSSNAWVNKDTDGVMGNKGSGFQSYGGQNSYAVNNYAFTSNNGMAASDLPAPADTVAMVDASYYNALPKGPANGPCGLLGDGSASNKSSISTSTSYQNYWRNLGNSYFGFNDLPQPTEAKTDKDAQARHSGFLNVIWFDGHSKATKYEVVKKDPGLVVGGTTSIWDPYKKGCDPAYLGNGAGGPD